MVPACSLYIERHKEAKHLNHPQSSYCSTFTTMNYWSLGYMSVGVAGLHHGGLAFEWTAAARDERNVSRLHRVRTSGCLASCPTVVLVMMYYTTICKP